MKTYLFFLKYVEKYRFRFAVALLIAIPIGLLDGVIPWSLKPFMDGLTHGETVVRVGYIPLMIMGFSILQGGLKYLSMYLNGYMGQKITMEVRAEAYQKLFRYNLEHLNRMPTGYIITRFFNDPMRVQLALLDNVKKIISQSASILSISVVMLFLNWKLCLIALGTISTLIYPVTLVRKKITFSEAEEQKSTAYVIGLLTSSLMGMRVLKSFNLKTEMLKRYREGHRDLFNKMMRIVKAQAAFSPLAYFITSTGIAMILWYGSSLVISGEMTSGALVAFVASLLMLYRPIRSLGDVVVTTQKLVVALNRMIDLMTNTKPEQPDTSKFPKVGPLKDKIEYWWVTFKYKSRPDPTLVYVNLTIEKGQTVALVGRSGVGKTTLAELMMGFYTFPPTWGDILYDGQKLRDINLESLWEQISYVNQDTFLFDGTLRENIVLGKLNATDEEIAEAVDRANLTEFIGTLELGMDEPIGERGVTLSGGQRQRVAIARAFLKDAPILVLDEATSSLDNESEAVVQNALENLMQNRTTLVIAHRLSTIRNADKIVYVGEGYSPRDGGEGISSIREQGTHEELMEQQGLYYDLYQSQFKKAADRLTKKTGKQIAAATVGV